MATHTAPEVHKAVIARLKADSTIGTLVSTRVYGPRAPQGDAKPYITVRVASEPFDTKTSTGHNHSIRVQCFAEGSAAIAKANELLSAVYASLHRVSFAFTGGAMIDCLQVGLNEVEMEPDNKTAQAVVEFNCLVKAN